MEGGMRLVRGCGVGGGGHAERGGKKEENFFKKAKVSSCFALVRRGCGLCGARVCWKV